MTLTSLLRHTVDDWHDKSPEGFLKHNLIKYIPIERVCRQVEHSRKQGREIATIGNGNKEVGVLFSKDV